MARGFRVTFHRIEGLERGRAAVGRLGELGADTLPFMQDARTILVSSVLGRFQSGRGPGGIPWKPTKRQTRQAVGVRGPNKARILVDTGDLQDSIRGEAGRNYAEVGSDGLKNPVKALANQFGAQGQTGVRRHYRLVRQAFGATLAEPVVAYVRAYGRIVNLPARPFVGIDDRDVEEINETWQARIIATYKGGGFG